MKKAHLRNILVPVDFSKLSQLAIETARDLARRLDAAVHLAHVSEFYCSAGFITPVPMPMMTNYDNATERQIRSLKALAKRNGLAGENCHLLSGTPPFQEICDLARKLPADLIVMPTQGRTGLTHFFEGSTAERIVQHAPCPVLVARQWQRKPSRAAANGNARSRIDTILVPVDFSYSSFRALDYAIELAERRAAKLIILHVMHLGHTFDSGGYATYDLSGLLKTAREDAELQMEEFVRRAKFRRVQYETAIQTGPPVVKICEFAGQRDVDLIVTATHGRTGLKHVLIGSVAERVVRFARQSVLVVPSRPEARTASLLREARRQQATLQPAKERASSLPVATRLTKRNRKLVAHSFPERRQTNKFRESHLN